jgi:hypothetical protein
MLTNGSCRPPGGSFRSYLIIRRPVRRLAADRDTARTAAAAGSGVARDGGYG